MPDYIFLNGEQPKPVGPAGPARHGEILCFSGVRSNRRLYGEMVRVRVRNAGNLGRQLFIIMRFAGIKGDSGAPVWNPRTGRAVGCYPAVLMSRAVQRLGYAADRSTWV